MNPMWPSPHWLQRLATPDAAPPQIALWQVKIEFDRPLPQPCLDWLSPDEQARAGRYHRHQDRLRYSVMRAALRHLLALRLGCHARQVRLASGACGKPYLVADGGLAFNQSHAGPIGLLALADGIELGIDIEVEAPPMSAGDLDGMTALMLGARERALAGPLDRHGFLRRWVAKEAALKALGVGIAEHLHALEIWPHDDGRYSVAHARADWPPVHAHRLDLPSGHPAALAWIQP